MSTTPDEGKVTPPIKEVPFSNRKGFTQARLRLQANETLEDAIQRFRRMGWTVPDMSMLTEAEDGEGKYITRKA